MPKRVPRKPRPKKIGVPKGYDSFWEYDVHQDILGDWKHHHDVIPYVIPHKYEPDFVRVIDGKTILLEAKGRFWDHAEYSKYIWIRETFKEKVEEYELVFLFQKPYSAMPEQRLEKMEQKELMLNGLRQMVLDGLVKKHYRRNGRVAD